MVTLLKRFFHDTRGTSLVEALIAFPLLILTYAIFFQIGVMMHTYGQNTKAVAVGARLLAVSDPLISLAGVTSDLAATPLRAGDPLPLPAAGAGVVSCTEATCTTGFDRLIYGSDGKCDADAADTGNINAALGMCDVSGSFDASDVVVTYSRSGLGYFGRPGNPVVTITVTIRSRTRGLTILDGLFAYFGSDLSALVFPPISATVTSEDLSSEPL